MLWFWGSLVGCSARRIGPDMPGSAASGSKLVARARRAAEAFQEHFPDVTERIMVWNQQIALLEADRGELEQWVEQRLRMLGYAGRRKSRRTAR
jgi:hypothetical protein